MEDKELDDLIEEVKEETEEKPKRVDFSGTVDARSSVNQKGNRNNNASGAQGIGGGA